MFLQGPDVPGQQPVHSLLTGEGGATLGLTDLVGVSAGDFEALGGSGDLEALGGIWDLEILFDGAEDLEALGGSGDSEALFDGAGDGPAVSLHVIPSSPMIPPEHTHSASPRLSTQRSEQPPLLTAHGSTVSLLKKNFTQSR